MLTRRALGDAVRRCGISRGQTVLLHLAYSTLEPVEDGPQGVLDTLLEILGPDGTLLVPTFTLAFCQTGEMDLRDRPETGIVPWTAMLDLRFLRVCHPIYSFAVAGQFAPVFAALRSITAAGADSVFALLAPLAAWQLNLGVDWDRGGTYWHHEEERWQAPYRFAKAFAGEMVTPDGQIVSGAWSLYVRDWDHGVIATLPAMGAYVEERGWVFRAHVARAACFGAPIAAMSRLAGEVLRTGRAEGLLYRVGSVDEARAA